MAIARVKVSHRDGTGTGTERRKKERKKKRIVKKVDREFLKQKKGISFLHS